MSSSTSLFFFISLSMMILLSLVGPSAAADETTGGCTDTADYCWRCSKTGDYTPGDKYGENLKNLLSSFPANTQITSGFYNSSMGQDPNKVNAIAMCRGDLPLDSCGSCLNQSSAILMQNCSTQKEAIIWAAPCMVRYSDNSIFGIEQEEPIVKLKSPNSAKNAQQFDLVLTPLLSILSEKAVSSGDSTKRFAAGRAPVPDDGETIYASAQCTPDIGQQNCSSCLKKAVSDIPECCGGISGARILKPSCNVRFEVDPFLDPNFSPEVISIPAPAPAPTDGNKSNTNKLSSSFLWIRLLLSLFLVVACVCC